MKILIVDDEAEIRRVLKLLLDGAGYNTITASDGESAINVLRDNKDIDLCIMDIMMPRMTGVEATVEIRRFSSVPILFLTARSLSSDKSDAYSSGGDDYIVKPFSSGELLLKVDALTRRYNSYSGKDSDLIDGIRIPGGFEKRHSYRHARQGD